MHDAPARLLRCFETSGLCYRWNSGSDPEFLRDLLQYARERGGDVPRLHGLLEDFGDAGGERALGEHRAGVTRNEDDGQIGAPAAQGARELRAADTGHYLIRDDGVDVAGLEGGERGVAIGAADRRAAERLQ